MPDCGFVLMFVTFGKNVGRVNSLPSRYISLTPVFDKVKHISCNDKHNFVGDGKIVIL